MIYNIVSLLIGWIIAAFVAPFFVYPVLYSGPRALIDVIRGRVRWWAPLVYLAFPVLAFVAMVGAGYLFAQFGIATRVLLYARNTWFVLGDWMGIGLVLLRLFTPSGRRKLRADYLKTTRPTD